MQNANGAFAASICVRGRKVKEVHHRGRTYIEGRKGAEYTLSFTNNTNNKVLVIPSIDGLGVADGKPAGNNSGGFIVSANDTITIDGWVVDDNTAAKFVFWPQDARGEQTYVSELQKSGAPVDIGNQGMIGFLVIAEKPTTVVHRDVIPNYENYGTPAPWGGTPMMWTDTTSSSASTSGILRSHSIGTKFGESIAMPSRIDIFNRGSVKAEMVLEYDTLRGLKDRGVPTKLFTGSNKLYGERSAFPANTLGCTPPKGWNK